MRKFLTGFLIAAFVASSTAYAQDWAGVSVSAYGVSGTVVTGPLTGQTVGGDSPITVPLNNGVVLDMACFGGCPLNGPIQHQGYGDLQITHATHVRINLSSFARSDVVSALASSVGSMNGAVNGLASSVSGLNFQYMSLTAQLSSLTAQLSAMGRDLNIAQQGAAMGIAMKDAIPNADDNYALRVNIGGFRNQVAGGFSFAAKLSDSTRVVLNYGQASSHSAFSGGLNFSFN